MEAAEQLFTAWMTSTTDGYDHAVTDEEFTAHRPEPEAVCGAVLYLAPMEQAPGSRCPRCVAFLEARATLPTLEQRLGVRRHRRAGWLYRLVQATLSPVVPRPRASARHDRPEPPAAMHRPVVAAGPEHPAGTGANPVPAGPKPLGAGEVASGRHQGTAPAAVRPHLAAAGAQSPAASFPGELAGSTSAPTASFQPPTTGVGADGSTAISGRAAAPPLSPQQVERRGTQSPADAACSPAAAPAGSHRGGAA